MIRTSHSNNTKSRANTARLQVLFDIFNQRENNMNAFSYYFENLLSNNKMYWILTAIVFVIAVFEFVFFINLFGAVGGTIVTMVFNLATSIIVYKLSLK